MEEKAKRLMEMTEWLINRPDVERILYANYPVAKDEEILELFQELQRREYYELCVFFLMRGEFDAGVQKALERFCVKKVFQQIGEMGLDAALMEFNQLLEEEIRCSEENGKTGNGRMLSAPTGKR